MRSREHVRAIDRDALRLVDRRGIAMIQMRVVPGIHGDGSNLLAVQADLQHSITLRLQRAEEPFLTPRLRSFFRKYSRSPAANSRSPRSVAITSPGPTHRPRCAAPAPPHSAAVHHRGCTPGSSANPPDAAPISLPAFQQRLPRRLTGRRWLGSAPRARRRTTPPWSVRWRAPASLPSASPRAAAGLRDNSARPT